MKPHLGTPLLEYLKCRLNKIPTNNSHYSNKRKLLFSRPKLLSMIISLVNKLVKEHTPLFISECIKNLTKKLP